MEKVRELFSRDLFAKHCGIELLDVGEGRARARMRITEHHLNGLGTVQGGAIFTLADFTFALACNSHGNAAVAINTNLSFVKAAKTGILLADAREVALNPKLSTVTVNVTNESEELIAIFQGMAYRKKETIDEFLKKS